MPYAIRFRPEALKQLLESVELFGEHFEFELAAWLDQLASEAEQGKYFCSQQADEILQQQVGDVLLSQHEIWNSPSTREILITVLSKLRLTCPPREFRYAEHIFQVPNSRADHPPDCPTMIRVFFLVHHLQKKMVIKVFRYSK